MTSTTKQANVANKEKKSDVPVKNEQSILSKIAKKCIVRIPQAELDKSSVGSVPSQKVQNEKKPALKLSTKKQCDIANLPSQTLSNELNNASNLPKQSVQSGTENLPSQKTQTEKSHVANTPSQGMHSGTNNLPSHKAQPRRPGAAKVHIGKTPHLSDGEQGRKSILPKQKIASKPATMENKGTDKKLQSSNNKTPGRILPKSNIQIRQSQTAKAYLGKQAQPSQNQRSGRILPRQALQQPRVQGPNKKFVGRKPAQNAAGKGPTNILPRTRLPPRRPDASQNRSRLPPRRPAPNLPITRLPPRRPDPSRNNTGNRFQSSNLRNQQGMNRNNRPIGRSGATVAGRGKGVNAPTGRGNQFNSNRIKKEVGQANSGRTNLRRPGNQQGNRLPRWGGKPGTDINKKSQPSNKRGPILPRQPVRSNTSGAAAAKNPNQSIVKNPQNILSKNPKQTTRIQSSVTDFVKRLHPSNDRGYAVVISRLNKQKNRLDIAGTYVSKTSKSASESGHDIILFSKKFTRRAGISAGYDKTPHLSARGHDIIVTGQMTITRSSIGTAHQYPSEKDTESMFFSQKSQTKLPYIPANESRVKSRRNASGIKSPETLISRMSEMKPIGPSEEGDGDSEKELKVSTIEETPCITPIPTDTSLRQQRFDVDGELRSIACVRSCYAWVLTREKLLLVDKSGAVVHRTDVGYSNSNSMAPTHQGDVYIYDPLHRCVMLVSFRGDVTPIFEINYVPISLCCLRKGNILVTYRGGIVRYSSGGKRLQDFKMTFKCPCKIAENKVTKDIYIVDYDVKVVILDREYRHLSSYLGVDTEG